VPEAPALFSLLSPVDGFVMEDLYAFPLAFHWEPAFDPDPNDPTIYELQISNSSDFTDPLLYDAGHNDSVLVEALENNNYWWTVKAEDNYGNITYSSETRTFEVTLDVEEPEIKGLPVEFSLVSLYPNPFNPTLTAVVSLPENAVLRLHIFNVLGRQVAELANGHFKPGYHEFVFNGKELSSGVYFIRAMVPRKMNCMQKVVLLR
jgi:hypothetical protein